MREHPTIAGEEGYGRDPIRVPLKVADFADGLGIRAWGRRLLRLTHRDWLRPERHLDDLALALLDGERLGDGLEVVPRHRQSVLARGQGQRPLQPCQLD